MSDLRIFSARTIHTMNPSRPTATHVAVRDGRIVMAGSAAEVGTLGSAEHDDSFAEKILLPGFVEGHAHVMEGTLWSAPYVGAFDRRAPDGRTVKGLATIDAVIARLRETLATLAADQPLYAWGFDPLHIGGRKLTRHDLDAVSTDRPVLVHQASLHITNVNSRALEIAGFDAATTIAGVPKLDDGTPSGELQGLAARVRLFRTIGFNPLVGGLDVAAVHRFADAAAIQGITTITDLHNDLSDETVDVFRTASLNADMKVRLVPALASASHDPHDGIAKIARLRAMNNDKLQFGIVKIIVDGSIQGFTARLRFPGYHNGSPNGLWYVAPDDLDRIVGLYHAAGVQMHLHTNGDEATEAVLDAVGKAQAESFRPDHRHTLQHCQMASAAQFRRMRALGLCVNLFSNHIFYWGDAHYDLTMGPERAARLDAAATADRIGVPYGLHCDAPVTPLSPLFTAWCAVNRMTSSGRVLGPEEALTVPQALRAVTLGAAYTLGLDDRVGSIEAGKFADFAVLDDDPFAVPPAHLKDVRVWGSVAGGIPHRAPDG